MLILAKPCISVACLVTSHKIHVVRCSNCCVDLKINPFSLQPACQRKAVFRHRLKTTRLCCCRSSLSQQVEQTMQPGSAVTDRKCSFVVSPHSLGVSSDVLVALKQCSFGINSGDVVSHWRSSVKSADNYRASCWTHNEAAKWLHVDTDER